jgi:hypothetical protein
MAPDVVGALLFSMGERQRFTQDTPILPEVWYAYAAEPDKQHDLLITPLNRRLAEPVLTGRKRSSSWRPNAIPGRAG